ncbi:MAG: hypothetical protein U0Q07_13190 [Acidimicrobiales bacterium]
MTQPTEDRRPTTPPVAPRQTPVDDDRHHDDDDRHHDAQRREDGHVVEPTAAERIVAAYPDPLEARQAMDHLETVGFQHGDVHLDDDGDRLLLVDGDRQEDEAADTVALFSGGLTTRSQTRGALVGTVLGGTLGFVASIPCWLIPIDIDVWVRILSWSAVGVLAGATIGFVYGGARLPQRRGEHTATPVGTTVSTDVHTDAEAALARSILSEQARRRADARAAEGRIPPDPSSGRPASTAPAGRRHAAGPTRRSGAVPPGGRPRHGRSGPDRPGRTDRTDSSGSGGGTAGSGGPSGETQHE